MQSHSNSVQNARGDVLQGAVVSVYLAGTETLATIYSDNGITAITNPITAGQDGSFQFWAANGRYDITSVYGTSTDTYEIILFDSAEDPVILDSGSDVEIGDPGTEEGGMNINGTTYDAKLRINDIGGTKPAQLTLHRHSTTLPSVMIGARANDDTTSHTAITASQSLFSLYGAGWTGTHYDLFGSIDFRAAASGTISATSSPGAIDIATTPDSSNTPAIAATIDNSITAGETRLSVYDVDGAAVSKVKSNAYGIVQAVEAAPYTTYSSHTTVFPIDDTIPQNTEGEEIITVTITPKSASNRLRIEANISTAHISGTGAFALFKDADADAIAVTYTPTTYILRDLTHEMAAGTTSAITFKLRAGPAAGGTIYLNGSASARYFGGIAAVRLRVEEIGTSSGTKLLNV